MRRYENAAPNTLQMGCMITLLVSGSTLQRRGTHAAVPQCALEARGRCGARSAPAAGKVGEAGVETQIQLPQVSVPSQSVSEPLYDAVVQIRLAPVETGQ